MIAYADERQRLLDAGGIAGGPGDPVRESSIKRKSILYRMPYWEVRVTNLLYQNLRMYMVNIILKVQFWSLVKNNHNCTRICLCSSRLEGKGRDEQCEGDCCHQMPSCFSSSSNDLLK